MSGEKFQKITITEIGNEFHLAVKDYLTVELNLQIETLPTDKDESFPEIVRKLKAKFTQMKDSPDAIFASLFEKLKKI